MPARTSDRIESVTCYTCSVPAPPAAGRRADDRHPPHVRGGPDSHDGRDRGSRVRLRPRAARGDDRRGCLHAAPDRRRPRPPRADPRAGRARQLALRGTRPVLRRGERGRSRALGRDRQARRRPARRSARTAARRGAGVRRRRLRRGRAATTSPPCRRRWRVLRRLGCRAFKVTIGVASSRHRRAQSRGGARGHRRRRARSWSTPSARSRASRTRCGASA